MTRDPFGAGGDFTTAPEISQVFGELIGVFVAQAHAAMGSPRQFALVELGPGRGTLMADCLRVLQKAEATAKAAHVHFVEISPVLRDAQVLRVPHATWHDSIASLPALPSIVIANEFFDALPIRQFEWREGRVWERRVILEDERLVLGLQPSLHAMPPGDGLWEDHGIREALAMALGDHLAKLGGLALVFDYGHWRSSFGDTLQALRNHSACAVTDHPGEADITAHVDFESLARGFAKGGMARAGMMTQGAFLSAMGIEQRTARLAQSLAGDKQKSLIAASERLAHAAEMGQLFKALAVASRDIVLPYPFGET
jgi:SAM-dependent MidA family methyltransferase